MPPHQKKEVEEKDSSHSGCYVASEILVEKLCYPLTALNLSSDGESDPEISEVGYRTQMSWKTIAEDKTIAVLNLNNELPNTSLTKQPVFCLSISQSDFLKALECLTIFASSEVVLSCTWDKFKVSCSDEHSLTEYFVQTPPGQRFPFSKGFNYEQLKSCTEAATSTIFIQEFEDGAIFLRMEFGDGLHIYLF